jgi:hypothetical protein
MIDYCYSYIFDLIVSGKWHERKLNNGHHEDTDHERTAAQDLLEFFLQ